jgi:DNA-binding winged helix-turn-helix (wHTH) protein
MSVRVVHGANEGRFHVEGNTVKQVAYSLRQVFNIPADAVAFVNGKRVTDDHMLADGSNLEFTKDWGSKGGVQDYWSEEEIRDFFGDEELQRMKEAGMKLTARPVLSTDEVMSWAKWLRDRQHDPSHTLPVRVDIENESITVRGKTFDIDQQMAAVVKCLLDAKGELRSTKDMKNEYPRYIVDQRLDTTIRRKLIGHKSGIGKFIITGDRRGYRLSLSKLQGVAAQRNLRSCLTPILIHFPHESNSP